MSTLEIPGRTVSLKRAFVCGLLAVYGCERAAVAPPRPPQAEFLLAAGDSTYWIRSGADGIRVRSAPILLTRVDSHLYEVFVTDDVEDFDQASFATARAFRRDIMGSDSVLVYEERTVPREAGAWQRAHPRAVPLDPDEDGNDEAPPTAVTDDIDVEDVHGPWLSIAYSLDVDVAGRQSHVHRLRRTVVDVRSGARMTLGALFGADEAARVKQAALRALQALQDSVRRSSDARGIAARRTLSSFLFDSSSFGLTDAARRPAVTFLVPGTGTDGEALALYLPPLPVAVPSWWGPVAATLPQWNADSSALQWTRDRYDIVARPAPNGDALSVALASHAVNGQQRVWPIAMIASPVYQLMPLDSTPLDNVTRAALARAFDESTALSGFSQRASWRRSATASREPFRKARRERAGARARTVPTALHTPLR